MEGGCCKQRRTVGIGAAREDVFAILQFRKVSRLEIPFGIKSGICFFFVSNIAFDKSISIIPISKSHCYYPKLTA